MLRKIRKKVSEFKWYPRDKMRKDTLYHARKHPDQTKIKLPNKHTKKMRICIECKHIVYTRRVNCEFCKKGKLVDYDGK